MGQPSLSAEFREADGGKEASQRERWRAEARPVREEQIQSGVAWSHFQEGSGLRYFQAMFILAPTRAPCSEIGACG